MPRNVAVVFERDFARDLQRMAFHTPVWIVDTPANHAAAEEAWHEAVEWPHITVTLFRPPDGEPSRDDWRALLEQIHFLEKSIDTIDVIGAELSPLAREALDAAGFTRFHETRQGFRARRSP